MFSAVFNISKKIEALNKKEQAINSYYDPQGSEKVRRHRHFLDIYQDYNEDIKNYGFSRYTWKREEPPLSSTNKNAKKLDISQKKTKNTPIILKKPKKPQNLAGEDYEKLSKRYKFWRYTKKYDVNLKSLIRNTSALSHIYLEGLKDHEEPIELNEYVNNEQEIEEKLNNFLKQSATNKNIYKQIPSDKEKDRMFSAFKESLVNLNNIKTCVQKTDKFLLAGNPQNKKEKNLKYEQYNQNSNKISRNNFDLEKKIIKFQEKEIIDQDDLRSNEEKALERLRKIQDKIIKSLNFSNIFLNLEKWSNYLSQYEEYCLIIVDMISLKTISIEIFLNNDNQVILKSNNEELKINILLKGFGNSSGENIKFRSNETFCYILIHNKENCNIVYEKLIFLGVAQQKIEKKIQETLLMFFVCLFLMYDPENKSMNEIREKSIYILERRRKFPRISESYFNSLKDRDFFVEDQKKIFTINLNGHIDTFFLSTERNFLLSDEKSSLVSPQNLFNETLHNTFFLPENSVLPIKPNQKKLKKRPVTAENYSVKVGRPQMKTLINFQMMTNNFIQTPMKGVFRGYKEQEGNDFRPIKVFGEGAKIYK